MIARENGLEPLRRRHPRRPLEGRPRSWPRPIVTEAVPTVKDALNGARDIVAERLTEDAELIGDLRAFLQREAIFSARVIAGQEEKGAKFSDYFDHREPWAKVPSHRALAMMRAANEGIVTLDIAPDPDTGAPQADRQGRRASAYLGQWPRRPLAARRRRLDLAGQAVAVDDAGPAGRSARQARTRRPSRSSPAT